MHRSLFVFGVVSLLALGLGTGCASSGGDGSGGEEKAAAQEMPIPADSPLAQIEVGMNDEDVRRIMGSPDDTNAYMTGKAWIPYYYGPDTSRSDWLYQGQGRVVFSRNRYSGALKVIRVMYNPNDAL